MSSGGRVNWQTSNHLSVEKLCYFAGCVREPWHLFRFQAVISFWLPLLSLKTQD